MVREQKFTNLATVHVHYTSAVANFWDQILAELRTREGFEFYPGAPPRGPLFRALQDFLK